MGGGELQHLCEMANQIAANFSFHDDQVERIADHIQRFWAPSMRRKLAAHIDQDGAEGLEAAVVAAMGHVRTQ
ncbi:MAG: formate dehydrogenase subunit delta [Xanthomonadales bacterium]|nr:formate dehydrogenase subunit delta [Xanthomonadales bacterium]